MTRSNIQTVIFPYPPTNNTPQKRWSLRLSQTRSTFHYFVAGAPIQQVCSQVMALERYLKTLDAAIRHRDGPSTAKCLSAHAEDIPFSKDFVPYLHQVSVPQQSQQLYCSVEYQPHGPVTLLSLPTIICTARTHEVITAHRTAGAKYLHSIGRPIALAELHRLSLW